MVFKKVKSMVRGYLTHKDIEKLEQAAIRPLKHKKVFVKKWLCNSCNYNWFYNSVKCPTCSSPDIQNK
ncbi:MAG: hypothetical protein HYT72_05270 [Candidatus Aenigmarchaeota archaeon]|nr:hypothetical protein [Candidatus Aenigmarchaeota archaeon]